MGTASRHRRPFLAFSLLSPFAFFRRLRFLLFSRVFVNSRCWLFYPTAVSILYFYQLFPAFILNSLCAIAVNWPPSFLTSAIYDFILGQRDRRRYNTTALLSLDCYTTAAPRPWSGFNHKHEHLDSGAVAWLVLMWPESISDSNPGR